MDIERISAFSVDGEGGNPAGVVIGDALPDEATMARVAAEVGYSETAFAALMGDGWRVRYFSPASEVPFCGHATIALGAALGVRFGAGDYALTLNSAAICVTAAERAEGWDAVLRSPPTETQALDPALTATAFEIFGVAEVDLDPDLPVARASAGADMLIIPLARRDRLARLDYDIDAGARLMNGHGLVGVYFIHRAAARRFDVRMAFASGGVFEDPATGAAAAALSGWLRDSGRLTGEIEIRQGEDMGLPSRLVAVSGAEPGAPVTVEGATRRLA